jgi:uncharacterized membrane protein
MSAVITADQPVEGAVARVRARLDSIDLLRGLVMVIMALDHVRDFFSNVRYDPLDLTQTSPALFFTRWITHFCAPTFVLLAGASAYFVGKRRDRAALSRFLLTRGLWLVFLEVTIVYWAWTVDFTFRGAFFLQVIWAIGISMIVLSQLVRLPVAAVGAFGIAMIVGHNAFDGVAPESFGSAAWLWHLLHVPGRVGPGFCLYPLVPWIGVMAAGYAFGSIYDLPAERRRRVLLGLGLGAIALFVLLRSGNFYGDAQHWSPQRDGVYSFLSFMNVVKYPPSLLFLCATLGPGMLMLMAFEHARGPIAQVFVTIGRVPLFFYVLHIALAHLIAGIVYYETLHDTHMLTGFFEGTSPLWGYDLPGVYAWWLLVVVALYPACRWFAGVKARRSDWWLSYL